MSNGKAKKPPFLILALGVGMLVLSFGFLRTLWTFKSELTSINGAVTSVNEYVKTVTDRRGNTSQVAELVFYLDGIDKKFRLAKDIGDEFQDEQYRSVRMGLKRSGTAKVWIRKGDNDEYEPEVFQIEVNDRVLLNFDDVRHKDRGFAILSLLMGLASVAYFIFEVRKPLNKSSRP